MWWWVVILILMQSVDRGTDVRDLLVDLFLHQVHLFDLSLNVNRRSSLLPMLILHFNLSLSVKLQLLS